MQQTANYNLNLPEGTDVVNPLVDYNPNFSTIDGAMKANADRTVGRATCIKSGTTHVVTRSNTGSNIINFTATGDWNAGDTMTIDSVVVSVFLPDGSAALDGAYLINSEVFGILNGTRFTLYSNITELTAATTSYDNTASGLTASNVQGAIDEIVANRGSVSVTANGVKTNGELFNELFALIDSSKINGQSYIVMTNVIYHMFSKSANVYSFSAAHCAASAASIRELTLKATASTDIQCRFDSTPTNTIIDITGTILSNGLTITLYYC